MLSPYLKNLEIIDVYCQNDFQEIYICKHKEENAYYLLNLIRDKGLFHEINLDELMKYFSSIKDISEVDEGMLVISEHYSHKPLLEYIRKDRMTLSNQINNLTNIIETLSKLKTLSDSFVVTLFNYSNLVVDDNGDIKFTGVILLSQEIINASREDVFNTIANTIHFIFTKSEIVDENISKGVPPDIAKIINGCLSSEYLRIIDLVSDYKSTSIYKLINPERDDVKRVSRMRKSMSRKRISYNIKTKGIIIALLLIPIIVWGSHSIIKNNKSNNIPANNSASIDSSDKVKDNIDEKDDSTVLSDEDNSVEDFNMEDVFSHKEDLDKFFNEDKIKSLGEKEIGTLDDTRYHRGEYSIKVDNDKSEKFSYLVGYMDFGDENFAYAKNRTVNVSLWLSSDVSTECSIILKLESKEKILSHIVKKVNVKANTWILHNVEINTKNGEYLKVYINIKPKDTIWVDTLDIDILK